MLFDIDTERAIDSIPHRAAYYGWKSHLTEEEYQTIFHVLDSRVSGDKVHTSSWIPGRDWTGTVFQPIYDRACGQDEDAAAKCFGLILWEVMMKRGEAWSFGRYKKDGIPIKGLTYFRVPGLDHLC